MRAAVKAASPRCRAAAMRALLPPLLQGYRVKLILEFYSLAEGVQRQASFATLLSNQYSAARQRRTVQLSYHPATVGIVQITVQ